MFSLKRVFGIAAICPMIMDENKEYDHLNEEIVNLEPGKHYEYVRYINSVVRNNNKSEYMVSNAIFG